MTVFSNAVSDFRYDLINTSDSFLVLEEVSKNFKTFQALNRVDLEIPKGSTVALIGASGSGKSTLLRILGGFDDPTSGRIWIEGENAAKIPPQHRNIGFVFQDYALFSHLTVAENIRFGLEVKNWPPEAQNKRVAELLAFIKLEGYAQSYPKQLSGGQQQRVALARAIAPKPSLLCTRPKNSFGISKLVARLAHCRPHTRSNNYFCHTRSSRSDGSCQ